MSPIYPNLLLNKIREKVLCLTISALISVVILLIIPSNAKYTLIYTVTITFLSNIIKNFVKNWMPKEQIQIAGKSVVISGCDTGFGHMLALKLDNMGFQVFAGCLFPNGEGAQDLKKCASDRLHILQMDVTKDEDMEAATTYINDKLEKNELWAVVCNAGVNDGGEINWTDINTIGKILEINTMGVIRTTKAFLPHICKSKGRVVIVTSTAAKTVLPGMVPYCMSKSATLKFCNGLRLEMGYKFGIEVISIEPSWYRTNITDENKIASYALKTWERTPDIIKNLYPADYINQYVKAIQKSLQLTSNNRPPSEVITCIEEAITLKSPKYSYISGALFMRITFWMLKRLPKPIEDAIISYFALPNCTNKNKYKNN